MRKKTFSLAVVMLTLFCAAAMTGFAVNLSADAQQSEPATHFALVEGASIRLQDSFGMRFVTEMDADTYADLKADDGSVKKMGVYVVPHSYVGDAAQYVNGETDLNAKNYNNLKEKIDYVFYDSADGENKIYGYGGKYYANAVIANLRLKNFGREFTAIGYISTESQGETTYRFTDIDVSKNVRSAKDVACRAYADYFGTDDQSVLDDYILGAYLSDKGMTETVDGETKTYNYGGNDYATISAAAAACDFKVSLDKQSAICYLDDANTSKFTATAKDGTADIATQTPIIWTSSDTSVAEVDDAGNVTARASGNAVITASLMGKATATAAVTVYDSAISVYKGTKDANNKVVLQQSTHAGGDNNLPVTKGYNPDMPYVAFNGSYGLNDYLVFDFTGDNLPFISFFNTKVTNSCLNLSEGRHTLTPSYSDIDFTRKSFVIANGIRMKNGTNIGPLYGGETGAQANRLMLCAPYGIVHYDGGLYNNTSDPNNGKGADIANGGPQFRQAFSGSAQDPSPIGIVKLMQSTAPYRMVIGYTAGDTAAQVKVGIYVVNLKTGAIVVDITANFACTDFEEGSIVLYSQFYNGGTTLDKVYAIEENTTLDALKEKHTPVSKISVYKGTLSDENRVVLNQSSHVGGEDQAPLTANYNPDMSYVSFNGSYGLNDYLVFDFTGDNLPFISFFNKKVTNSCFNLSAVRHVPTTEAEKYSDIDFTRKSFVITNGVRYKNGNLYPGQNEPTNNAKNKLMFFGPYGIVNIGAQVSSDRVQNVQVLSGSDTEASPLSTTALEGVTDQYRVIIGFTEGETENTVKLLMYAVNLETGATVLDISAVIDCSDLASGYAGGFEEGSIALYGQFGKTTTLDKIYDIEEETTLDAVKKKHFGLIDYSAVYDDRFESYAYTGPTDGTYIMNGETIDTGTDFRTTERYTEYKNAGFNVLLAQSSITINDATTQQVWNEQLKPIMDAAHAAGLKVILTDQRISWITNLVRVTSSGTTGTPWTFGENGRFLDEAALDRQIASWLSLYKDHPAFYGVMLADEPSYQNAENYGAVYKSLKRVMPEIHVQYNLLPLDLTSVTLNYRYPSVSGISNTDTNLDNVALRYKAYLQLFIDATGADYVQYDDYPMRGGGSKSPYISETYLRGLQVAADLAKEKGIELKFVAQTCGMKTGSVTYLRSVSEADARWINNTLLGFGVKQINYFTYFTKQDNSDGGLFIDGASFIRHDGTKTELYTFMQQIMSENQTFAPTVLQFDYVRSGIYKSNSVSVSEGQINNVKSNYDFSRLTAVAVNKEYTLVTELYDKVNNNYMYMAMNAADPSEGLNSQNVTMTFGSYSRAMVYKNGVWSAQTLSDGSFTATLAAGEAVYVLPY